jgi:DNA repair protein RadC
MQIREIQTSYRIVNESAESYFINNPKQAADLFSEILPSADVEHFIVFNLTPKNEVIAFYVVSKGTVSETIVHAREVYKTAILSSASAVIVAHNHPSEGLVPSREDIATSRRIKESGDIIGIQMLDSIIVNSRTGAYTSLKEEGYF